MVNVLRLRERLEFITRNRQHHDQGIWAEQRGNTACGTTGCLAGWTALEYGKDQLWSESKEKWVGDTKVTVIEFKPRDGEWWDLGADLLELPYDIADELFEGTNSLWDLWNISNIITNGQIEIPGEVDALRYSEGNRTDDDDFIDMIREMMED